MENRQNFSAPTMASFEFQSDIRSLFIRLLIFFLRVFLRPFVKSSLIANNQAISLIKAIMRVLEFGSGIQWNQDGNSNYQWNRNYWSSCGHVDWNSSYFSGWNLQWQQNGTWLWTQKCPPFQDKESTGEECKGENMEEPVKYILSGFCYYVPRHYISYVRDFSKGTPEGDWYKYNDQYVSAVRTRSDYDELRHNADTGATFAFTFVPTWLVEIASRLLSLNDTRALLNCNGFGRSSKMKAQRETWTNI